MSGPRTGIVNILKEHGANRILDVCCGAGTLAAHLVGSGLQVVGMDASPTMLNRARERSRNVEWIESDVSSLPYQREFDAAVISLALHEMTEADREATWKGMQLAVREGGLVIALDYTHPRARGMVSSLVKSWIKGDEKSFLNTHAPHYENYKDFMRLGGVSDWIRDRGHRIEAERYYWAGNLGLIAVLD